MNFNEIVNAYRAVTPYPLRRKLSRALFAFNKDKTVYKKYIYDKKCIFVHIPKAAGKSVALAVYGDDKPGHYFAKDYKYCDPVAYKDFFTFCFVRDPITRFESAYNFLLSGGTAKGDMEFKDEIISQYQDINHFVEQWVTKRNILLKEHFVPQYYFTHENGKLIVDYVGKFENILHDYEGLKIHINDLPDLPFTNKNNLKKNSLNENSIKKLKSIYNEDFECFGYMEK